jgi:F-type H+-transporting ATPase subunit a
LSGKTIGIIIGALAVAIVSTMLLPTGDPHVSVKAETIFQIAPGIPFTNSLLVMIITDVILIVLAVAATSKMDIVPRGMQNIMEMVIEGFYNLFAGVNREWIGRGPTFPIIMTIMLFVLTANWLGLLPGVGPIGLCKAHHGEEEHVEDQHAATNDMRLASTGAADGWMLPALAAAEPADSGPQPLILGCAEGESIVPLFRTPSADLNFTFGLALLAFVYIEITGFQALGVGYLGKFFNFKDGVMGFIVGLLELISEFARILAFAFRLFGNIFAGEVVLVVLAFMVPLALPLPFYFFEVFVGFIQAFVFAILTMAFIAIAVTPHGGDHH